MESQAYECFGKSLDVGNVKLLCKRERGILLSVLHRDAASDKTLPCMTTYIVSGLYPQFLLSACHIKEDEIASM